MELFLAISLGLLFGVALNRTGATNPENIINMLRLTDLRLMKAIIFAIGLATIGLFGGLALGVIDPSHVSVKSAYVGVIAGGALLGTGFAIAGYCPGTGLAAAATGREDAIVFTVGGLLGALAYTLSFGWLTENVATLYEKIAGGDVSLAVTGNEKHEALIGWNGTILGLGLGTVMIAIAVVLPLKLLGEKPAA